MVHKLEKREYIDGIGWIHWRPVYVFDHDVSENPRLDALTAFDEMKAGPKVLYRVVDGLGRLVIEQR